MPCLRRSKATSSGTTHFLWDQQNVLAELDANLDTTAQHTDFPGFWGGLSSRRTGAGSAFFAGDLSANVRALLDAAGATAQGYLYEAFGPERLGGGGNPYRFGGVVGYYREGEERLYVRARHYLPDVGRWGSRDPVGLLNDMLRGALSAAPTPYCYAFDTPVEHVDPTGAVPRLWPPPPGAGVISAGVGAWLNAIFLAAKEAAELLKSARGTGQGGLKGVGRKLANLFGQIGRLIGALGLGLSLADFYDKCFVLPPQCDRRCCTDLECWLPCIGAAAALAASAIGLLGTFTGVGFLAVAALSVAIALLQELVNDRGEEAGCW